MILVAGGHTDPRVAFISFELLDYRCWLERPSLEPGVLGLTKKRVEPNGSTLLENESAQL